MKRLNITGKIYMAYIKVGQLGSFKRVYEKSQNEDLHTFAMAVYEDIKNEFPKYTEIDVIEYGDSESDYIIEIYKDDDPTENIFYIVK